MKIRFLRVLRHGFPMLLAVVVASGSPAAAQFYKQTALVSDLAQRAAITDCS